MLVKSMVFSKEFFHIYALTICFMFFGFYMMSSFKTFGATEINDDMFLTLIGSFGGLFNGFTRIIFSSLLDYYPIKTILGYMVVF